MNHYTLTRPESKLALHTTNDVWAADTFERLIRLGCSEPYARKVAIRIQKAVKV